MFIFFMNKEIYTLTCARAGEKEIYERLILISFFIILLGAPIQERMKYMKD